MFYFLFLFIKFYFRLISIQLLDQELMDWILVKESKQERKTHVLKKEGLEKSLNYNDHLFLPHN